MRAIWVIVLYVLISCGVQRGIRKPIDNAEPTFTASPDNDIEIVWIGHATVLLRIHDKWILTDPVFGDRVGAVYKRYVAPGMQFEDLPPLDVVAISHAHLDHLEIETLEKLQGGSELFVPRGMLTYLPHTLPFARVHAMDKWQQTTVDGLRITAIPAMHSNGRYGVDALWRKKTHTGFMFEYRGKTVYFAGDTGYKPGLFPDIRKSFDIDVALLPVGPADRWAWVHKWRRSVHLDPVYAIKAFEELDAKWMVPIHYGTFFKSPEDDRDAIAKAIRSAQSKDQICMITIGETFLVPGAAPADKCGVIPRDVARPDTSPSPRTY